MSHAINPISPPPSLLRQPANCLSAAAVVDPKKHAELTRQAQKLVSQTFFGTMLKQMRNSPFKSEVFSGGRGGSAFNEMFDQHLADRMARGAGRGLANSIAKYIENGPNRAAQKAKEPGASVAPTLQTALTPALSRSTGRGIESGVAVTRALTGQVDHHVDTAG